MANARTRAECQQELVTICNELASNTMFARSKYAAVERRARTALIGEAKANNNPNDQSIAPYSAEELNYYREYLRFAAGMYLQSSWTRKPTPRYLGGNDGNKTTENGFLPIEMWGLILANLSFKERTKLRTTCKDFNAVVDNITIENPILVSDCYVLIAHPPIFNEEQNHSPTFISLISDIAKLSKTELKELQKACLDDALALKAIGTKETHGRTLIYNHSTSFLILGMLIGPSFFLAGAGLATICLTTAIINPAVILICAAIISAIGLVMLGIAAGIYINSKLNSDVGQKRVVGFFDKVKASSVKVEELDDNGNVVKEIAAEKPKLSMPWWY